MLAIWRRQMFHVSMWEISLTTYGAKWTVFNIAKRRKFHYTQGRYLNNHLKINTRRSLNLTKTYVRYSWVFFSNVVTTKYSLCRETLWVQLHGDNLEITAFICSCLKKYDCLQPPYFAHLPLLWMLDGISWKSIREEIKSSSPTLITKPQSGLKQILSPLF